MANQRRHIDVLQEIVNELEALTIGKAFRVGMLVEEYAELRIREATPIIVTINQVPIAISVPMSGHKLN